MIINVVGLGYIGLPTSLMFAVGGSKVIGTDKNKDLVEKLNNRQITFKEEGLETLFFQALEKEIIFQNELGQADMYIVSVPTPYDKESKKIDASFVVDAVKEILYVSPVNSIIVIESTISPGTIERYIEPLIKEKNVYLVHAPERIIPGNMINELRNNNRTIGTDNLEIADIVREAYETFCNGEIVVTDIKTAEMSKVVENTYRAVNIAFANELAQICHYAQMDVNKIIEICNKHPRVNILSPGPGVGGHCISVDPWFLVGDYPNLTNIIKESMETNAHMPEYVLKRISEIMLETGITDKNKIGLYGLTYKEDVDDIRESPTLQLLERQRLNLGEELKVYDPYIKKRIVKNQYYEFEDFVKDVDLVVIMVKHSEIRSRIDDLKGKIILDCQHIIDRGDNVFYL